MRNFAIMNFKTAFPVVSFSLALFLAVLAIPSPVLARHGKRIVPSCGTIDVCKNTDGSIRSVQNICTPCDLLKLAENILNFIWWHITAPLAALFIAYGGALMILPYLGQSTDMAKKGRTVVTRAAVGILIVFFAWLAIDTIIKVIGQKGGQIAFGPWNTISCEAGSALKGELKPCEKEPEDKKRDEDKKPPDKKEPCTKPGATKSDSCDADQGCPGIQQFTCTNESGVLKWKPVNERCSDIAADGCPSSVPANLEERFKKICREEIQLEENCIVVKSSGNCFDRQNNKCTSFENLPQEGIADISLFRQELKNYCAKNNIQAINCQLIINGGTEVGHKTHGPGRRILDFDNTDAVNGLIREKTGMEPTKNKWVEEKDKSNKTRTYYYYEGNHWHVCFDSSECPKVHETEDDR
jgi:hypothetical protein